MCIYVCVCVYVDCVEGIYVFVCVDICIHYFIGYIYIYDYFIGYVYIYIHVYTSYKIMNRFRRR